jgi:hypothetical protein
MNVIIDGIEYVPGPAALDDETRKLLAEVYGSLWMEAYYDPTYGEVSQKFAAPLADKMQKANERLQFKR